MSKTDDKLDKLIELMSRQTAPIAVPAAPVTSFSTVSAPVDEDALYQRFKARLVKEAPGIIKLLVNRPEFQIEEHRTVIEIDLTSARGMIAKLISEGFFDQNTTANSAWKEAGRRWNYKGISARMSEQLNALTTMGFVTKESDGYRAVPDMKVSIKK